MKAEKKNWTIPEFTDLVIGQAQEVLDQFGEWGDRETELGIIRKARFTIPRQDATLRVHEIVDPETLWDDTAPFAYNILRDDWRGSYDILLSVRAELGARALMTLNDDLTITTTLPAHYPSTANANEYKSRYANGYPSKPKWPTLHTDDDFPPTPRSVPHRSTLSASQYKAGLKWHSDGRHEHTAKIFFEPEKYLRNSIH